MKNRQHQAFYRSIGAAARRTASLLEGNGSAGILELLLELFGLVLGNALLDRLRSALDELLGLFEAEAGDLDVYKRQTGMRRMILPLLVLGSALAKWITSGVAMGPMFALTWLHSSARRSSLITVPSLTVTYA